MLTDVMESRPLIRTELTCKAFDCEHLFSGLVDCAATLDFVSEDSVRRFSLTTRKFQPKTPGRVANGQCVRSSTVYDINFELNRYEPQRNFYVLRYLRAAYVVLGLPCLDDEYSSLHFGTTRGFTLMDGTTPETNIEERRLECLLMSSSNIHELMRRTRCGKGRNAEFYVIDISLAAEQPAEFHKGEELT
jgi:hypothetical protein